MSVHTEYQGPSRTHPWEVYWWSDAARAGARIYHETHADALCAARCLAECGAAHVTVRKMSR